VACRLLNDEVSVECTATVSGDPDELLWSAPGGDPATGTGERFRTTLADGGPYRVQLEACQRDACSASQSRAFVIRDPDEVTPTAGPPPVDAPTVLVLDCEPEALVAGDSATCSGVFGGDDVETYDWTVSGLQAGSGATLTRAFTTVGARTVTLQVCNEGGCDTDSVTVIVQAPPNPEPPVINLIGCAPLAVQVGTTVSCTPTVDGEVDSREWVSGDVTGSLSTFLVSYETAGTQTIALEACNADGCDSAEASITVTTGPPGGVPLLQVSATALDFGALQSQLSVQVTNDGTQPLEWSVGGASGWISLGLHQAGELAAGEQDSFLVTVSRGALTSGPHSSSVSVTSNGGNATLTVQLWKNDVIDPVVTAPVPNPKEIFVAWDQTGLPSDDPEVVAWFDGASAIDDLDGVLVVVPLVPAELLVGSRLVAFTAQDAAGNIGAATATLTVTNLPQPPIVTITCTTPVLEGVATACSVESNLGGVIADYVWSDTGGGPGGTGETYSPTLLTAGLYTVTLVATNDGDSDEDTAFVSVQIEVPDFTGVAQATAEAAIGASGLSVGVVTTENHASVPEGDVISQDPVAGTAAGAGASVALVVSLGVAPVSVPNVVGMTQAAATAEIATAELTLVLPVTEVNDAAPVGQVIGQSLTAGDLVAVGSPISITVSLGPVQTSVPNVVGMTQAAATAEIATAELTLVLPVTEVNDAAPVGQVIGQSLTAGNLVAVGSPISITVSLGPVQTSVPNVVGMTLAAATAEIAAAELTLVLPITEVNDAAPAGTVIGQSLTAGNLVAVGSPISITVSLGP
jgi:beta-lactam-binding protein with PASTA domain